MKQPTPLELAIDRARAQYYTDSRLAQTLGISRSRLADLLSGRNVWSPELVAKLGLALELSGSETRELVAYAIIEAPRNASQRAWLQRALFTIALAGVAIGIVVMTPGELGWWTIVASILGLGPGSHTATMCKMSTATHFPAGGSKALRFAGDRRTLQSLALVGVK